MIRIKKAIVDAVRGATTPQDLFSPIQKAVSLELSTIPVYLSGLFTLKETDGANATVAEILTSVVNEEMLHMCIAANLLTALGGAPRLNTPEAVPSYPGPLPGDTDDGLKAHLYPFSTDAVLNLYMRIEEPDKIVQPSGPAKIPLDPAPPPRRGEFQSIGDFYRALITKLESLPANSINSDPASPGQKNQVVNVFFTNPKLPARISDIDSAVAALNVVISQGEGSATSPLGVDPLDAEETPAHFYRFAEIIMGKEIQVSANSYDFSGAAVTFDVGATGVYDMYKNPTLAAMKTLTSPADFKTCQDFAAAYTALLDGLDKVFSGNPSDINHVINRQMIPLAGLANKVLQIPAGNTGKTAGLCFELFRPPINREV